MNNSLGIVKHKPLIIFLRSARASEDTVTDGQCFTDPGGVLVQSHRAVTVSVRAGETLPQNSKHWWKTELGFL